MSLYKPEQWEAIALNAAEEAQLLFDAKCYRGRANRAYYAAYQAATAVCVRHGDAKDFPPDWNNPAHGQLPELIQKNGSLSKITRLQIIRSLRILRSLREDADYRPGLTVDNVTAFECMLELGIVLRGLGLKK